MERIKGSFYTEKRRRFKRDIGLLLAAALVFNMLPLGEVAVSAAQRAGGVKKLSMVSGKRLAERQVRTEHLLLTDSEQESEEQGWSWKKDDDSGTSYTLTLNQVDFQVSDHSAVSLYLNEGIPIESVRIVLNGENHIASTNILPADSSSYYKACGFYIDAYDAERAPAIQICGGGSMTVEGNCTGMLLTGTKAGDKCSLSIQGVKLTVETGRNGGISTGGDVAVEESTVITDTFSAGRMTVQKSVITAAPVAVESSYAKPVLSAASFDISDSTVSVTGADGCQYEGMASGNSSTIRISNSNIDIRNVEYGISATAGTIEMSGVTGRLSCLKTPISGNSLAGGSGAFAVNRVNATDSVIFAQAGQDILAYGDCMLPEDITELTVGGDLQIQDGKSFTVGKGQKITFTKNYATVGDLDSAVLVNYGTLEFVQAPLVRTKLENHGTLLASGINGKNERFVNDGIFDGIINEKSGAVHYVYGNVVAGNRTLGKIGAWNYQTILMPGAVFTIPDGRVMDAATYLTWDNLGEYLVMGEGSRIIVEEGGKLLLPAVDEESQVVDLNLSGDGTVQMGDRILHKVFYMDGDTVLADAFIGVDGIVAQPAEPQKDGYIFNGWYTEPEGGENFEFLTPVESSIRLYAHWDVMVKDVMLQSGASVLTGDNNVIIYGQALSELELNNAVFVEQETDKAVEGSIAWKNPLKILNAGTVYAEWVFTPDDSIHYARLSGTVEITVEKAVPYVAVLPEAAQITEGSMLSDSVLTGGRVWHSSTDDTVVEGSFTWKDASVKPTALESSAGFTVVFTPHDGLNYNSVEMTVKPVVKPAGNTSGPSSGNGIIWNPGIVVIPSETQKPGGNEKPEETQRPDSSEKPEETQKPDSSEKPEETQKPDSSEKPEETQKPGENSYARVKSVKLSKTLFTYNGKAKKPSVTAFDADGRRILAKYYTVSYINNKKAGRALVMVTFKNGYSGIVKKTFTIRPVRTIIKNAMAVPYGFTVKWIKKTVQTDGYQLQYSTNAGFEGNSTHNIFVKKASVAKKTIKKQRAGKKLYVRIRTYKTIKTGGKKERIYSVWSRPVRIKTI